VGALIAARHLMRAPHLRKYTDVYVFDVSARDSDGNDILGLACRGARMTADAAGMVDDLGPLHAIRVNWFNRAHSSVREIERKYITAARQTLATAILTSET
jgi:hypothetical protein